MRVSSQALSDVAQAAWARAVIDLGDAGRADTLGTDAETSLDAFSAQAEVPVRYLVERGHRHIAHAMLPTGLAAAENGYGPSASSTRK